MATSAATDSAPSVRHESKKPKQHVTPAVVPVPATTVAIADLSAATPAATVEDTVVGTKRARKHEADERARKRREAEAARLHRRRIIETEIANNEPEEVLEDLLGVMKDDRRATGQVIASFDEWLTSFLLELPEDYWHLYEATRDKTVGDIAKMDEEPSIK